MPIGLMTMRTATPPELEQFHDDPAGLLDYVTGVIERAEANLLHLYFDIGGERAYAIVEGLDDYVTVKAVSRILGAESFTKMVTVDGAVDAIEREASLRGSAS
jgi:hypothetical protein